MCLESLDLGVVAHGMCELEEVVEFQSWLLASSGMGQQ